MKKEKQTFNLLEMRPVRVREFEIAQVEGADRVVVLIPRFGYTKIGQWFNERLRKPYHKIKLDELGSFVWNLCDGNMQVKDICNSLREKFGEKVDPVHDRVALFLKQMEKSSMIDFKETAKTNISPTFLKS
jgi:hypothetical protein